MVAYQVLPANRSCAVLAALNQSKQRHHGCTRAKQRDAGLPDARPRSRALDGENIRGSPSLLAKANEDRGTGAGMGTL
jgi:hypothetical protein